MFLDIFDKKAYFPANLLHIIKGLSQPLLVISQFSQFFAIMAHTSLPQLRGISTKFYVNIFYFPWPPPTFKTIKKFHVKSFFTSAQKSTVNNSFFETSEKRIIHNLMTSLLSTNDAINDTCKIRQGRLKTIFIVLSAAYRIS